MKTSQKETAKKVVKKAIKKLTPKITRRTITKKEEIIQTKPVTVGKMAPDFSLLDQNGEKQSLKLYRGKKVLLYFYPKDDTPRCTVEACSFRDGYQNFLDIGLVVLGVSGDDTRSHKKFADKYNLPFPLLADIDHGVAKAYGVWVEKSMYGRKYMGIERSSFLIDEKGRLAKIYEKVKPTEHSSEVKDDLQ